MQRKYSVIELDHMRTNLRDLAGVVGANPVVIEERLRTYMMNGTEPLELEIANLEKRIDHWRGKLINHGSEMIAGYRTYFPLLEMRKFIFKLEALKARNGL